MIICIKKLVVGGVLIVTELLKLLSMVLVQRNLLLEIELVASGTQCLSTSNKFHFRIVNRNGPGIISF